MDLIAYAGPFFVLFIAIELLWDWRKGTRYYRLNDSVSSLSLGILSTASKLVVYDFGALILIWTGGKFGIWQISLDNVLAWVLTFVGYDFLYYWYHRISHERQLFWVAHVAHHQSEEFNLTTALRQTSMSFFYVWIFFIPCFIAGVPGEMYFTVAAVNLLYQFWVHTRHVGKLGWVDKVFVTPSNHRAHHARNATYIDKNYGGVFILWDRMFNTFQEELIDVPVEYGISKPLKSWNPVKANLHILQDMLKDCSQTKSRRHKLGVWFARTGWRPADLPATPASDLSSKYNPECTFTSKAYALSLLISMYAWGSYYIFAFLQASLAERLAGFSFILLILIEAAAVLDGTPAGKLTRVRRVLLLAVLGFLASYANLTLAALYGVYALLLLGGWIVLSKQEPLAYVAYHEAT